MAQRARPRDLYDIVNLFRRNDLRLYPEVIRQALAGEVRSQEHRKSRPPQTSSTRRLSPARGGLVQHALATSCPRCRPLQGFLDELPLLFGWLDGTARFEELPPVAGRRQRGGLVPTAHRCYLGCGCSARDRSVRRH